MTVMNILLFLSTKEKKYLFHSIFLFCLVNVLFQISGIQKITIGFNSIHTGFGWGLVTCLTGMCFLYNYCNIKKIAPKFAYFQAFFAAAFIFIVANCFPGITLFKITACLFAVLACGFASVVAIFLYKFKRKLTKLIMALVFSVAASASIYVLANYGVLEWNAFTSNVPFFTAPIGALLFTIVIMEYFESGKKKIKELEVEASTDELTTLFNRKYYDKVIIPKIIRAEKERETVSMFMLDIDHFKKVNDTFGHNAGDVLLHELAGLLTSSIRKEDFAVRWGGEEFIVVLFHTNINDASIIAEKIRQTVETHKFQDVQKVTVSIGVAEKRISESIANWILRADTSLYTAKEGGRNRVEVSYANTLPIKIEWSDVFECKNTQINDEHK